ncbi:Methylase involved in ubiquinone/menaquinone biosynthesis [Modestobacter sp. DSM 44400]|uniref:class I SAM-dependent methyltransferase n=1 Tax=Modestobacter sp. DSM 44400 TaxID=1550230 RepID=UPI0008960070|nr:methyltransferase domain-containing protein [Modestobacter sp. DSM 44400]SDY66278.1 Methylase involved in ubiquinone/menaquinone biosynthesis [Modestobacter sp. DSM 44400]
MPGLRRYDLIARGYDLISLERWLYARPRARALALLGAQPGDTVLDLGCGTGLNFPALVQAVGDTGRVIGVDASAGMLTAAADRVRGAGWNNVTLIHDDITDITGALTRGGLNPEAVDAVTACYVLSLLDDDTPVWRALAARAATGPFRMALAELAPPDTAPHWQRPGWRLLARLGGARPRGSSSHSPWRALHRLAGDAVLEEFHGGHVRVAVGTLRPARVMSFGLDETAQEGEMAHPRFARTYLRVSERADRRGVVAHRRVLLAGLSGTVGEVGAGNGLNFRHYPPAVTRVLAVEPEPTLRAHAQHAAGSAAVPVDVLNGTADALPIPTGSCDAVVASLVLCSVPDLPQALAEIRRVLRPGGQLRFYEHVRSPGRLRGRLQDALTPAWAACAGGCRLNRDTAAAIAAAGFAITAMDRFTFRPLPYAPPTTHILGCAVPAGSPAPAAAP